MTKHVYEVEGKLPQSPVRSLAKQGPVINMKSSRRKAHADILDSFVTTEILQNGGWGWGWEGVQEETS